MPGHHASAFAFVPFLLVAASLPAQGVLALQRSFHLGAYSGSIDAPSGALELASGVGSADLLANGSFSGHLDLMTLAASGATFTPNDPFGGLYSVAPDGTVWMDLDPAHPGNNVGVLWIDAAGSVMHSARFGTDENAFAMVAIAKSTGMSNASVSGTYYYTGQGLEFVGGTWHTWAHWGLATFDGAGNATIVGSEQSATPTGSTTVAATDTITYTIAADGSAMINNDLGAVSSDGNLLFAVTQQAANSGVGITIAVRVGGSYDLQQLGGRFSLTGLRFTLGTGTALPRTTSEFDSVQITGFGPGSGAWTNTGIVIDGTSLGQTQTTPPAGGSATLTGNGVLTLADAAGTIELGVAANGRYAVGRRVGPATNVMFALRQCPPAFAYGSPTAGTGGVPPSLGMRGFPTLGNGNWRLRVDGGIGGGVGVVGIGFAPAPGVPALGGLIWIDPTNAFLPLLLLGGASGQAGAGSGEVGVVVPNVPSLEFVRLDAQALVLDPAAPAGFSMSGGFEARLCR